MKTLEQMNKPELERVVKKSMNRLFEISRSLMDDKLTNAERKSFKEEHKLNQQIVNQCIRLIRKIELK